MDIRHDYNCQRHETDHCTCGVSEIYTHADLIRVAEAMREMCYGSWYQGPLKGEDYLKDRINPIEAIKKAGL